jgi:tetraacyldisaccharide 4'-kinase
LSVGNLTVGGTGKTPVSAWLAERFAAAGAHPALVLRGYGEDEPEVHRILNPGIPVIVDANRRAGVIAARDAGADIAVLDDAFQHRRAHREADVVLVSADRGVGAWRLLPAGPWREPPRAARRASLLVVTRKAVDARAAAAVEERLAEIAPQVPQARVALAPHELMQVDGAQRAPLDTLRGARVSALLSIADPDAFVRQLEACGARVSVSTYADHHVFTDAELGAFVADAARADFAVCTLKDAVKIAGRWPRAGPLLWYVSQHVHVERGADAFELLVERMLRARHRLTPTAG